MAGLLRSYNIRVSSDDFLANAIRQNVTLDINSFDYDNVYEVKASFIPPFCLKIILSKTSR